MAKSKWIVPAVAMMLCAVSLIGAGYAAYTATLTDNESITADNNFVTLTLGARSVASEINIYYDSEFEYSASTTATSTSYIPYLDLATTPDVAQKQKIGSFSITVDAADKGDEVTVSGYTLAIGAISIASGGSPSTLTGATVQAFSDEDCTTAATLSSLASGTTYYLALVYTQDGDNDVVTSGEPSPTLTINYVLTVTANIANA